MGGLAETFPAFRTVCRLARTSYAGGMFTLASWPLECSTGGDSKTDIEGDAMKRRIFVVDDEASVRGYLFSLLSSRGYSIECFESGEQMLKRLSSGDAPGLILLDVLMPECSGIEVAEKVKALGTSIPIIMLSGVSHIRSIVQSMQMGAQDFLIKPFEETVLESAIEDVFERRETAISEDEAAGFITSNPKMQRLRDIVRRVAYTDVPILVLGESGVGKEVVARYAHLHSGRKDQPFVKVNCAAMPNDLLESELFGYDRGAFTGALNDKIGKFELAHNGTLLLDEIGEMSPHLQAKLLHVLQDGTFSRLGARKSVRVDARIIAATNIKLEDAISRGKFREDLYYRLNVISLEVPPLRERPDEIPHLCNYYVKKYRERYKSTIEELPGELMRCFVGCPWPGNIRQLENVIKRFLILRDSQQIIDELSPVSGEVRAPLSPVPESAEMSLLHVGANAAEQAQRDLVLRTLVETGWNRKKAAARLNICYKSLLNKLKRWNLDERGPAQGEAGELNPLACLPN